MILNQNQQSDVQIIGDIQNNKIGIDTKNINFITSLLTTNLYSKPLQSFIRETVANGWDSQIEADTTDKPIILRFYLKDQKVCIAIRDYGTGLSPERFQEIYLNIGSSTKRSDNQYVGAFGIGRFSALSISNVCHLTNYYNGTLTKYIMYQDNGNIAIDKLFEKPTEEANGLEVDVNTNKFSYDYENNRNIQEAIESLVYYPNIFISNEYTTNSSYFNLDLFNRKKIIDFKTFKINTYCQKPGIIMGNVYYSVEKLFEQYFSESCCPFVVKIPIGEVDIIPSREALQYTNKTIETLNKYFQKAYEEIKDIIQKRNITSFDNIEEAYKFFQACNVIVPLYIDEKFCINFSFSKDHLSYYQNKQDILINNTLVSNHIIHVYDKIRNCSINKKFIRYNFKHHKFYIANLPYLSLIDFFEKLENIYLNDSPLTVVSKQYFNEINNDFKQIIFLKNNQFKNILLSICHSVDNLYPHTIECKSEIRFIYEEFKRQLSNLKSFNNEDVPQSYIDEQKVSHVKVNLTKKKYVIGKLIDSSLYDYNKNLPKVTVDNTIYSFVDQLNRSRKTIFYASPKDIYFKDFYLLCSKTLNPKCDYIVVAKSNQNLLENLPNCIDFKSIFIKKNNIVSKIVTYAYLYEKWGSFKSNYINILKDAGLLKNKISHTLCQDIENISRITKFCNNENVNIQALMTMLCNTYYKNNWLNYNIITRFEENLRYLKLTDLITSNDKQIFFVCALEYYTKHNYIKNHTIINKHLKFLKDEYTPNTELPHFNIG